MRESGSDGKGEPVPKDGGHQWEPELPSEGMPPLNPPSEPFPVTSFFPPLSKSQLKPHASYKQPARFLPASTKLRRNKDSHHEHTTCGPSTSSAQRKGAHSLEA